MDSLFQPPPVMTPSSLKYYSIVFGLTELLVRHQWYIRYISIWVCCNVSVCFNLWLLLKFLSLILGNLIMICVGVNLSCLVFIELHKHVNLHFSSILKRFCPYFLEYFFFKYFFCLHPVFLSSHYTVIGVLDNVPKAIKTLFILFLTFILWPTCSLDSFYTYSSNPFILKCRLSY